MKPALHVERKVVTQTLTMLLVSGAIAILTGLNNVNVLAEIGVPRWASGMALTVVATALSAAVGYKTKPTARPDLAPAATASVQDPVVLDAVPFA